MDYNLYAILESYLTLLSLFVLVVHKSITIIIIIARSTLLDYYRLSERYFSHVLLKQ